MVSLNQAGPWMNTGSVPQMPSKRATAASERPTVMRTCSMCRWYSRRIRTNSVKAAKAAPAAAPTSRESRNVHQLSEPVPAGDFPTGEGAEGQEGSVRKVEHAHQPVDQGQPGGHEEVQCAEAEAGEYQQDDGAHSAAPFPAVRGEVSGRSAPAGPDGPVDTPRCRWISRRPRGTSPGRAGVDHAAAGEHDGAPASWRTTCRFCSTSRIGHGLGRLGQGLGDLGDDLRARGPWWVRRRAGSCWCSSSTTEHRDHLLLSAGEGAGHLGGPGQAGPGTAASTSWAPVGAASRSASRNFPPR